MSKQSKLAVRVYIEDTDIGGVVYYANYLKYLERARTEYFRDQGLELRRDFESDTSYVVHSLNIKYQSPAKLDDLITVLTSIKSHGKTFLDFEQSIIDEKNRCLLTAELRVACVSLSSGKIKRLSQDLLRCVIDS